MKKILSILLMIGLIGSMAIAGTSFYDWTNGETITATRLNASWTSAAQLSTSVTGVSLTDNSSSAFDIKEGSNSYMKFVTTNGSEKIQIGKTLYAASDATISHQFISSLPSGYCILELKNNSAKYGYLGIYGSTATDTSFGVANADTTILGSSTTNGMLLGSIANASLRLGTNNAVRMTINGAGTTFIHGGVSLEGTIRTNQNTTAPSTSSYSGDQISVYGSNNVLMGRPTNWILININGTNYKIPAY